jgi:myxalamid-type polyketide synthase MxaB
MNSRSLQFADDVCRLTDGQGVDVVLNSLSGGFISASLDVLRPGGSFVELGVRDIWDAQQVRQHRPDVRYFSVDVFQEERRTPGLLASLLRRLLPEFEQGRLRPITYRVFPIEESREAFRHLATGQHIGKVVLALPSRQTASCQPGNGLIRRDASYLITGGFGALGLRVARWLVDQGARYLVLAGRRGASSEAARAAVAALQAAGAEVLAVAADVSRAEDVAGLPAAANRFPPLAGILHLAGVLDDGVLLKQDLERLDRVMAPKVAGAWNLHILASRLPLDFFVVFSSAAGLLGAPGQANYAAANAFLDALMHYRRRQGLPALSIDWGPWGHEGMASVAEAGDQDRWSSRGIGVIRPELGLRLLGSLMGSDITQVAALSADWPRLLGVLSAHGVEPLLSGLAQAALSRTPQENGSERDRQRRRKLIECGPDQRRALATTMIQEEVAGVLRLASPDSADPQQGFFHMGMDSLAALELRNRLQVVLDRRLPATIAMECSNVTELAEYVVDKILETSGIGTVAVPAAVEQEDSLAPPSRLEHPSQEDVDACIADELAELENYLEGT